MQTIVVATDFSTDATNAMEFAASLAKKFKARLILFNSYQLPDDRSRDSWTSAEIHQQLKKNREYLEGVALLVARKYKIRVDHWTNLTYVAEGLDKLVKDSKAELVVMGMWRNAKDDAVFGNTTTFVIQQASYPVLVVPEGSRFKGFNKILFSWDPQKPATSEKLKLLKALASGFDARVQVLQVNKSVVVDEISSEMTRGSLEQLLDGLQYNFDNFPIERDIPGGIERSLQEYEADLLVMMPRKPGFQDSIFFESSTCEMALRTKIPLLALPLENQAEMAY